MLSIGGMTVHLTAFARKCLGAARRRLKPVLHAGDDPDARFDPALRHLLRNVPAPVIFDVGAHRGESIARYKKMFPKATFHAFEPDAENFAALSRHPQAQTSVRLNNAGVSSSKGMLTFYHNLKSNTSGFHAVNVHSEWAKTRSARHHVAPEAYTSKTYDVPVVDLDHYLDEHSVPRIHLLKIDTQGHEDEVLKGAQRALTDGRIDIIETEIIVGDSYVKSLQLYDLERILIPAGYRFYGIDNHGDLYQTPSLSFNLLYVRQGF